MTDEFEIGDVVLLKSGGPKMSVTYITNDREYMDTTWFAGSKKESGRFPTKTIVKYQQEPKS